jgi:hypothetical protein
LPTANVAGADADRPRASTKRAVLIGMLERPDGASVAELGQRLGWLPHTVRAAITGLDAYVMQDEARHVAFGRIALRDYYPQLSDAERNEREEFVVDACWHMRDRFNQLEVWQRLGLPIDECLQIVDRSEAMNLFRSRIFSRVVPTVRDIGLWGQRVQEAFAAMGAIEFADVDPGALLDNDARVADEFDARLRLRDALPQ